MRRVFGLPFLFAALLIGGLFFVDRNITSIQEQSAVDTAVLQEENLLQEIELRKLQQESLGAVDEIDLEDIAVVARETVATYAVSEDVQIVVVPLDDISSTVRSANAEDAIVSASLYKLFLAEDTLIRVDNNELALSDGLPNGLTVEECLELSIIISSNDCSIELAEVFGWDVLDERIRERGGELTFTNNYFADGSFDGDKMTNAVEVTELLRRIYSEDTLLSEESNELFKRLLDDQEINDRLPVTVPEGTTFSHKTGNLDDYFHDAGVVSVEGRQYIFSILTSNNASFDSATSSMQEALQVLVDGLSEL